MLVTKSRDWRASWNGSNAYSVKMGTRAVTVDLDARTCDCRVYDLTGIPCEHAIAAIHDQRHHPVDYVSKFYKKEKFLASYSFPLEALKGEEFWEIHSTDELLPPDLPQKLRRRSKRMRRKESWEGGNRSQPSQTGPILQRYSNKRIMHCSLCGQETHRKSNCPTKNGVPDEDTLIREIEQGQSSVPPSSAENSAKGVKKKKSTEELRRKALQKRKQVKNVVEANEVPIEAEGQVPVEKTKHVKRHKHVKVRCQCWNLYVPTLLCSIVSAIRFTNESTGGLCLLYLNCIHQNIHSLQTSQLHSFITFITFIYHIDLLHLLAINNISYIYFNINTTASITTQRTTQNFNCVFNLLFSKISPRTSSFKVFFFFTIFCKVFLQKLQFFLQINSFVI